MYISQDEVRGSYFYTLYNRKAIEDIYNLSFTHSTSTFYAKVSQVNKATVTNVDFRLMPNINPKPIT